MAAAVLENENTLGTKVEPHSIVGSRHTDVLQSEAWCDSRATRELKGSVIVGWL